MPKICGNTRQYHLTALLAALLAIACGDSAGTEQIREIRAHWLPGCGPGATASAARIDLQALGDFDPSPDTYEEFEADVVSAQSVFPVDTRAVLMRADDGFSRWRGVADVGASGNVDIALWPVGTSCTLFDDAGAEEPFFAEDSSAAIGFAPSSSTVLVTGGGAASASALTIDLTTGALRRVPDSDGPRTARHGPTVTPLGDDLLVSGGADPDTGDVLDTADVYRTDTGRFETRLDLSGPRTHHAGLPLASGETLLVGGLDDRIRPVRQLEAISPDTLKYRISGLAQLRAARAQPSVIRLTTGEILVAGGLGENGEAVTLLEWLDPTASRVVRSGDLSQFSLPAANRAFTPMPGGGVLAAGGCALRDPVDDDEALTCDDLCGSGGGCPSSEVLWILPDGSVVQLEPLDVPAPLPAFVPGAGGRPWLIADQRWTFSFRGLGDPPDRRHPPPVIRVFDPFRGRFQAPEPTLIPESDFSSLTPVPIDAGLFLWLVTGESPAFIRGFRHGVRNPYSAAVEPLLLQNRDGLSPDRPVTAPESEGGITLDDPELRLILTDTTYDTVRLTIITGEGPPPIVELGSSAYGDADCEWPSAGESGPLILVRTGTTVTLEHDGRTRECKGPEGRVSIALRAPESVALVSLTVQRSAD